MIPVTTSQFALDLLGAGGLGAVVGLERQWHQRIAGTRTNSLVAAGASAFVMAGSLVVGADPSAPSRIASFVVSGIGFLGAGVIFKDGATVHGLNTAATIWCSAAIGVLAGLGSLHFALIVTAVVLLANIALAPLVSLFHLASPAPESIEPRYKIEITCRVVDEMHLRALLVDMISHTIATIHAIYRDEERGTGHVRLRTELSMRRQQSEIVEGIAARLSIEPGVTSLSWFEAPTVGTKVQWT
jgi:putative Mg2+ transporter-C (MgtC) family protein